MKKSDWLYVIGLIIVGFIMILTWKYSNYALYDRIGVLEKHVNLLAGAVEHLNQEDKYVSSIVEKETPSDLDHKGF